MADPTPTEGPDKEQLKQALKAFKKRLKLTRLEEESKIGRNPTTTGRGSSIVGIIPPNQFPAAVWEELIKQGKLRRSAHNMLELVE